MLLLSCMFVMWMAIKPASSETVVVYEEVPQTVPIENTEANASEVSTNQEEAGVNNDE